MLEIGRAADEGRPSLMNDNSAIRLQPQQQLGGQLGFHPLAGQSRGFVGRGGDEDNAKSHGRPEFRGVSGPVCVVFAGGRREKGRVSWVFAEKEEGRPTRAALLECTLPRQQLQQMIRKDPPGWDTSVST